MTHEINTPTVFKSPEGESQVMALYDTILARWTVEYQTEILPTRHGDTFVITSGEINAEPLILLHGAGTNSTMWIGDVQDYSKHFRVYAVDIIGEAGKSAANRPAWDSPAYEEWLIDVLRELRLDKVTIIGLSQGAWTALKFATAHPERVKHLVLISPGGILPDKLGFVLKVLPLMMLGSWGIKRIVKMLYGDQTIPEGVTEVMITMMTQFNSRLGVLPIFSDEELSRLTMPILLIGGTKDALRNIEKIAQRLQSLLPNITINLIQGGGHALNDTVNIILPFLLNAR